MENKNLSRWDKAKGSSGFYHFAGLGLFVLALTAERFINISDFLKYATCVAGLIFMVYGLIIQMSSIWRNANREVADRNKDYDAKAEAANAYLFGTKTNSEQE